MSLQEVQIFLVQYTLPFRSNTYPLFTSQMKFIIFVIEINLNTLLFKIMKLLLVFLCQKQFFLREKEKKILERDFLRGWALPEHQHHITLGLYSFRSVLEQIILKEERTMHVPPPPHFIIQHTSYFYPKQGIAKVDYFKDYS